MLISEYEFPNIKYEFPNFKRYVKINGQEIVNDFKTTPNKPKKSQTDLVNDIERVIINNPAVIILWKDGTKTIAKCEKGDTFDKEKGLLVALAKHYFGNKQLRQFLEKYAWDEDKEENNMHFEKISREQWKKDYDVYKRKECVWSQDAELVCNTMLVYDDILLPKRATKYSAGYDFFAHQNIAIPPNSDVTIPTGIRWVCDKEQDKDKVLEIHIRSSLGFKYGLHLKNLTGIVDADYCNSDNEGHIFIKLYNPSDDIIVIEKGKAFAQGIIKKYYVCDDDEASGDRVGGFGSTDK